MAQLTPSADHCPSVAQTVRQTDRRTDGQTDSRWAIGSSSDGSDGSDGVAELCSVSELGAEVSERRGAPSPVSVPGSPAPELRLSSGRWLGPVMVGHSWPRSYPIPLVNFLSPEPVWRIVHRMFPRRSAELSRRARRHGTSQIRTEQPAYR